MKTTELYLKVLNDVRFNMLSFNSLGIYLSDYPVGSAEYNAFTKVNEACSALSSLITMIEFENK